MRLIRVILAAVAAATAMPAIADPAEFLRKAIQGDNSETRLGALASTQGHSARTRQFGTMLVRDHRMAKRQAIPVAMRHHVPVSNAMMDEAREEYAKLQRMHGRDFDREFAQYMVEDHRKDIAEFEREANGADPADVRALARTTLPALRKHLATARALDHAG